MGKYEMERIREMKEFLKEKKEEAEGRRMGELENGWIRDRDSIQSRLASVLRSLAAGRTGGVIVIAYLRSSYILRSHDFYIAYYEEEPFVEEEPEYLYFSFAPLFHRAETDWDMLEKEMEGHFIRIQDGEREGIRRWYMEGLYRKFGDILEKTLYEGEEKTGVGVYYGSYMDEVKRIGTIG